MKRLEGISFPTPLDDDGGRSHESDATAVYDGAGQEIRAPQRGSQTTGVGVDTLLLGKSNEFSGAQDA